MMTSDKYFLKFGYLPEFKYCTIEAPKELNILAEYLMFWGVNPIEIVDTMIPKINFGLKYGTKDSYCKYRDVEGIEKKMKDRWYESNLKGLEEYINIEESWDRIKDYTGYYIKDLDFWLEGIGGDVTGIAFITDTNTTIDGSDIGDEPMELPSIDFKEIVIEWLAFILRSKEILPKP
ncbi:MAG: hypothetical protein ABIV51_07800 [Saprospiraceae bacterium]